MVVPAQSPFASRRQLAPKVLLALAGSLAMHAGIGVGVYFANPHGSLRQGTLGSGLAWGSAGGVGSGSDVLLDLKSISPPEGGSNLEDAAKTRRAESAVHEQSKPRMRVAPPESPKLTETALGENEVQVSPGVDDSKAKTDTWIGASTGTEHQARQATTEQPAWSRTAGGGGREGAQGAAGEASDAARTPDDAPRVEPDAAPDAAPGATPPRTRAAHVESRAPNLTGDRSKQGSHTNASAEARVGTHDASSSASQTPPRAQPTQVPAEREVDSTGLMPPAPREEPAPKVASPTALEAEHEPLPQDVQPATKTEPDTESQSKAQPDAQPDAKADAPADAMTSEQQPDGSSVDAALGAPLPNTASSQRPNQPNQQAAPGKQGGAGPGETRGAPSDSESPATSTREALVYRPGTPLAREGLRIQTKLPRFSTTARMMTTLRNPIIIMKFNRRGRVVQAAFADGKGTGSPETDGALLDCIYEWTATGKKLRETPGDADTLLVFTVEYRFHD